MSAARGVALVVEGVSKRYRLGGPGPQYLTLRDAVTSFLARAGRRPAATPPAAPAGSFLALDGISFTVEAGEVVGVVGRNGAGKSTLLRILSRVTWPSAGRVALYGRVGSLLDVGTGFHSELTGRENVFLSGAILGMTQAETRRKFDQIVAFAGVERFLDTAVKHYSSGMWLRLAFAVAAHLDADIVFIDEALAVGDVDFQARCIGKIQEIAREGRTVLLVSHQLETVVRLCGRALWLDGGRLVMDGAPRDVVGAYLEATSATPPHQAWPEPATAPGNDVVRLRSVRVRTESGETLAVADTSQPFGVELTFDVLDGGHVIVPRLEFLNAQGVCVFWAFEVDSPWHRRPRAVGRYRTTAWVPGHLLAEGSVSVGLAIQSLAPWRLHLEVSRAVALHVTDSRQGLGARGDYVGHIPGLLRPLLRWTTEEG